MKPITVFATNEGNIGKPTSSGWRVDPYVTAIALPCVDALHWHVRLFNPRNGRVTIAEVLDVGPWNEHDRNYVLFGARPLAELGFGDYRKPSNPAGIDLTARTWAVLGMVDNGPIEWVRLA